MSPPADGPVVPLASAEENGLTINDHLSVDRTTLANERTLLAYVRTSLQLVVAGVSLLKFFDDPATFAIGVGLIPIGIMLLVLGFGLFVRRRQRLAKVEATRDYASII